jgi:uncharacterized protein YggU (UPF0235/DUF167 family)
VQAAPVAGKANEAVVELLAKYFSVPKSSVKVLRGQSSRKKLVEIDKWERDADSYDSSGLLAASLRWAENRLIENI